MLGDGISHPRAVTEAIHKYNVERSAKDRVGGKKQVAIYTYDLKNFFTNVPREKFTDSLRLAIQMIRAMDPSIRFF
jgi:hypothetical protein